MSDFSPRSTPETEEQLLALLATLKVEPAEEADFESRFLAEFHERVAREAVCCPARRHLFAHIIQMLDNFGRGRIAIGASAMGIGLVAVVLSLYPAEQSVVETAASVKGDRPFVPMMLPALSNDLESCTSIRVEPQHHALEMGEIHVVRGQYSTVIEVPNNMNIAPVSLPPAPAAGQGNKSSAPVVLPASSARYAF